MTGTGSPEAGGVLLARLGMARLELAEASEVSVRNQANGAQGMDAELGKGTIVFSVARAASLNVIALEASIRPAADSNTVAQISIVDPKELRIRTRRGALQLSYRGETETLVEGKSYRVILDPPNNDPKEEPVPPSQLPKGFKIVIIGEAAAIVALGIYELRESESPDRP